MTMTPIRQQALVFLLVLVLALNGAAIIVGARAFDHLRDATRTQCKFDSDLGGAPIAVNPATKKASVLGVSIVADARVAWRGLGCPGHLPPAAPSFVKWAKFYHLPSD